MGAYALIQNRDNGLVVAAVVVEHAQVLVMGNTPLAERLRDYGGDLELLDDEDLNDDHRVLAHATRSLDYQPVVVRRVDVEEAFGAAAALASGRPAGLPTDGCEVRVNVAWRRIGEVNLQDGLLVGPEMPPMPGVYRWSVSLGEHTRLYVGETANLRRRFAQYRAPGPTQITNQRMAVRAARVLDAGGTIEIRVADPVSLSIRGCDVPVDLSDEFTRRLVENAALVELVNLNAEVINGRGRGGLRDHPLLG